MLKEFKEFAMRGNALDMAVGIIIGAAFGRIVTSFVEDILMPPLGKLATQLVAAAIVIGSGTHVQLVHNEVLGDATRAADAPTHASAQPFVFPI